MPPIINHFLILQGEEGRKEGRSRVRKTGKGLSQSKWCQGVRTEVKTLNHPRLIDRYLLSAQFSSPSAPLTLHFLNLCLNGKWHRKTPIGIIYVDDRRARKVYLKRECDTGVSVPGAFKLDHLQSVKPILFPKFSNFYIFIVGSPILITPERGRLKMGNWNSPNLSESQGFQCPGHSDIQTRPFAAY